MIHTNAEKKKLILGEEYAQNPRYYQETLCLFPMPLPSEKYLHFHQLPTIGNRNF